MRMSFRAFRIGVITVTAATWRSFAGRCPKGREQLVCDGSAVKLERLTRSLSAVSSSGACQFTHQTQSRRHTP